MGVGTGIPATPALPGHGRGARVAAWASSPVVLRRLALAAVLTNVAAVVTGGAVRLTGSGLGCPTWPSCTESSLVPTRKVGINGAIEFTNRTFTFLVGAVLVVTFVAAWRQRRETRLAALALAGIPAQAVLGGIVVRTDLNPWLVAAHFLLSVAIIAVTMLLWWRVTEHRGVEIASGAIILARSTAFIAGAVLVIGTVVSGSGPHAGDLRNGKVHRIHISPAGLAQLHADAVMVLIGVTIGMFALASALRLSVEIRRAAAVLFGVELAQGAIGYTQYFLHVPALLVALHMLGACLVWVAALRLLLLAEPHATAQRLRQPPAAIPARPTAAG